MTEERAEGTAAVQYQFMRKQRGYSILHDAAKAGMMEKTGIVKSYPEPQRPKTEQREVLSGQIEEGERGLMVDGLVVVDAQGLDDGWAEEMPSHAWLVTVEVPQPPVFREAAVPNEYFRVAADAVTLDDAVYVGERLPQSISDLVKLGYDAEEMKKVWSAAPPESVVERARDSGRSQTRQSIGQREGVEKTLWLEVEYPLYDLDGDGIAERLFVHRIGNQVLKVLPVDEQPYSLWSPFPMQHRLTGQSMADKTMDIQRIRSVLLRQALDSLYLANAPRTTINENSITADTIDDLLTVRPGALIRHKGEAPQPLHQVDTSTTSFQAMEMMSGERESRTGVTRQSQGLNPDTMNKTASGMAMLQASSEQIELYVTRNFAEFLIAPMFAKRYRLMRQYGQPFRMKIEGKYTTVDPSKWPEDIDMAINIGLGTGNKDQRLQYRTTLLGMQKEAMMAGLRIVGEEQIYQNMRGLIQDSGLGSPSQFILDPSQLPPAEPQPNPEALKMQSEAAQAQQAEQNAHQQAMARLQLQQEQQNAEAAIKAQSSEQALDQKREAAALDAQLKRDKATEEARLAESRQAFEMDLALRRLAFEQDVQRQKGAGIEADGNPVKAYRPGGSLAE